MKKNVVKKRRLKRHHKIILMSAFGAAILAVPLFGSSSFNQASLSGNFFKHEDKIPCQKTSTSPCPVPSLTKLPHAKSLSCGECSAKTLCFSASKKMAYCGGPAASTSTPTDATCVTCPEIIRKPTPSFHPIPSCFRRVPQTETNGTNTTTSTVLVPCAASGDK